MPLGIGRVGDDEHDRIIKDVQLIEQFYRDQLSQPFQDILRYWKIYLTQRDDYRKPEESWRANFATPMGFVVVETLTAVLTDTLLAADPPIQAEGVGDEDEGPARKVERLYDYTLRVNEWRKKLEILCREASIQGTALYKWVWKHENRKVKLYPSSDQLAVFERAVDAAMKMGAPPPPTDPQGFAVWRDGVQIQLGVAIPQNPYNQTANVTTFRAPAIERVPLFDCRFDPSIEDIDAQPCFIQRIVRTKAWVLERTGEGPDKPFDPYQVEHALADWGEPRFSQYETEIAAMLGLSLDSNDPTYLERVELWEVFRPMASDEGKYLVVMNRSAAINKDTTSMPYGHGENPISAMHNISIPGQFLGLSDLASPEKLFYELDSMRNLRVDATTLATLPVFAKLAEMGLPDAVRMIRPGAVWSLPRLDGFRRLTEGAGPPPEVWREIPEIKADIEEATTAYANVRGAPSTVGRVSAREAEQRANSAVTRVKVRAMHHEEEFHRGLKQVLWLWYQFGDPEEMIRVGGDYPDPYLTITKDDLLNAFDIDFRLRGATRSGSRELQTQQLMDWGKTFGPVLKPHRLMALASRIFENMGLKGRQEIVPDGDIAQAKAEYEAQKAAAQQAPPPAPPKPLADRLNYADAPPDVQRQIEAEAGLQPSALGNMPDPRTLPAPPQGGGPPDEGAAELPPELIGGA